MSRLVSHISSIISHVVGTQSGGAKPEPTPPLETAITRVITRGLDLFSRLAGKLQQESQVWQKRIETKIEAWRPLIRQNRLRLDAELLHKNFAEQLRLNQVPPDQIVLAMIYARLFINEWLALQLPLAARNQPTTDFNLPLLTTKVWREMQQAVAETIVKRETDWDQVNWDIRHCRGEPLQFHGKALPQLELLRYAKHETGIYFDFNKLQITPTSGEQETVVIQEIRDHTNCLYLKYQRQNNEEIIALPTQLGEQALPRGIYQAGPGVDEIIWDKEAGQFYATPREGAQEIGVRLYLSDQVKLQKPLQPTQFATEWQQEFSENYFNPKSWELFARWDQHRDKLSPGALANLRSRKIYWHGYHENVDATLANFRMLGPQAMKLFHEPPFSYANCFTSGMEQGALEIAFGAKKTRMVSGWLEAVCESDFRCALLDSFRHFWTEQWDGRYWTHDVGWVPPDSVAKAQQAEDIIRQNPQAWRDHREMTLNRIGHVELVRWRNNGFVNLHEINNFALNYYQDDLAPLEQSVTAQMVSEAETIAVSDEARNLDDDYLIIHHNGRPVTLPTLLPQIRDKGERGLPIPHDPHDQLKWHAGKGLFILVPGNSAQRSSRVAWKEVSPDQYPVLAQASQQNHSGQAQPGQAHPERLAPELRAIFDQVATVAPRYEKTLVPLTPVAQIEIANFAFHQRVIDAAERQVELGHLIDPGFTAYTTIFPERAKMEDLEQGLDVIRASFALAARNYGHPVRLVAGLTDGHIQSGSQHLAKLVYLQTHLWAEFSNHVVGSVDKNGTQTISALSSLIFEPEHYRKIIPLTQKLTLSMFLPGEEKMRFWQELDTLRRDQPDLILPEQWSQRLTEIFHNTRPKYVPFRKPEHLAWNIVKAEDVAVPERYHGNVVRARGDELVIIIPELSERALPVNWLDMMESQPVTPLSKLEPRSYPVPSTLSGRPLATKDILNEHQFHRVAISSVAPTEKGPLPFTIYYSPELDFLVAPSVIQHFFKRYSYREDDHRVHLKWKYQTTQPINRLLVSSSALRSGGYGGENLSWLKLAELPLLMQAPETGSEIFRQPDRGLEQDFVQQAYQDLRHNADDEPYQLHDKEQKLHGLMGAIYVIMQIDQSGASITSCKQAYDIPGVKPKTFTCPLTRMNNDWEHNQIKRDLARQAQLILTEDPPSFELSLRPDWRALLTDILEHWGHQVAPATLASIRAKFGK